MLIDSGASVGVTNTRSWLEDFDDKHTLGFDVVSPHPVYSEGSGTIPMHLTALSGVPYDLQFHGISYVPGQPHNVLSLSQLQAQGYRVDFDEHILHYQGEQFPFQQVQGVFPLSELSPSPSDLSQEFCGAVSRGVPRDPWNWQFFRSEAQSLTDQYGDPVTGDFFELFRQPGNELFSDGYSLQSSNSGAFGFPWHGRHFYGNPVFENSFIKRTLEKALDDFAQDPNNTSLTFLAPKWMDSDWWHLTRHFEIVREYDTGSVIFSAPRRGTYNTDKLQDAGEEGGPDRVIIEGIPWPVVVLRKTAHTVATMDDHLLLHVRMGHAGVRAQQEIISRTDIKTGLNLHRDKVCQSKHCTLCQLANQTRPEAPSSDHATHTDLYSMIYSDIHGPVRVPSHKGYRYMISFTCSTSRRTHVYYMARRSDAMDCFMRFVGEVEGMGYSVRGLHLRTDNAKEYTLGQFRDYCTSMGVTQYTSAPYQHTGNAIAERLWRTINNKTRAFLAMSKLDRKYWPLAAAHAVYV
jgi:hypothetical protein